MRLALTEIYSICPSANRPYCIDATHSSPTCTKRNVGCGRRLQWRHCAAGMFEYQFRDSSSDDLGRPPRTNIVVSWMIARAAGIVGTQAFGGRRVRRRTGLLARSRATQLVTNWPMHRSVAHRIGSEQLRVVGLLSFRNNRALWNRVFPQSPRRPAGGASSRCTLRTRSDSIISILWLTLLLAGY